MRSMHAGTKTTSACMHARQVVLIKQPSSISGLSGGGGAPLDLRVVRRLALRAIGDHLPPKGQADLHELGLPRPLIERLYEDLIALTLRLVLDVCLTFQVRPPPPAAPSPIAVCERLSIKDTGRLSKALARV